MKQNKGRSFASIAKSLDIKYKNRVNDKILDDEYHQEMQKLVQQQEAVRDQMGLSNDNGQDRMMPEQFGGDNRTQYINDDSPQIRPARSGLDQFMLNLKGGFDENKPQLFKDLPITDTFVGPVINYLTGAGGENGSLAMIPGLAGVRNGAPPNINFAKNNAMYNIAKNSEREIGALGKTAKPIVSPINKVGAPIRSGTYSVSGTYPKAEVPVMLTESRGVAPSPFEGTLNRKDLGELHNAFNPTSQQKVSAGMRQKGTAYPSEGKISNAFDKESRMSSGKKALDDLAYEEAVARAKADWTPWNSMKNDALGLLGVGAIGAGAYGASQIDLNGNPIPQTQIPLRNDVVFVNKTTGQQVPVNHPNAIPIRNKMQMSTPDNENLYEDSTQTKNPRIGSGIKSNDQTTTPQDNGVSLDKIMNSGVGYNPNSFADAQISKEVQPIVPVQTATKVDPFSNNGYFDKSIADENTRLAGLRGGNELLPSYISAGANVLNNVLQGVLTRKPKNITPASYKPKEIDMTDRELEAKRQAELSSNISRNQARNMGLNAGATIANQAGAQSGIDRNLASALTDINQAEQQYNVGEANKAMEFGASNKMRADMINEQMAQQFNQAKLDSLSGTIGVIPELMNDINRIKYQEKMLKQAGIKEDNMIKVLSSGNYGFDPKMVEFYFNQKNKGKF